MIPAKLDPVCNYVKTVFREVTNPELSIDDISSTLDRHFIIIIRMLDKADLDDEEIFIFINWISKLTDSLDSNLLKGKFNYFSKN